MLQEEGIKAIVDNLDGEYSAEEVEAAVAVKESTGYSCEGEPVDYVVDTITMLLWHDYITFHDHNGKEYALYVDDVGVPIDAGVEVGTLRELTRREIRKIDGVSYVYYAYIETKDGGMIVVDDDDQACYCLTEGEYPAVMCNMYRSDALDYVIDNVDYTTWRMIKGPLESIYDPETMDIEEDRYFDKW